MISKPLKPSIKLQPLTINKKHKTTNIEEIILWLFINLFKEESCVSKILISKK